MAYYKEMGKGKYRLFAEAGYDAKGKRIRRTKTVEASGVREAKRKLAEFETEINNKNYVDPQNITLSAFVDMWKENHAKINLDYGTRENYYQLLDNSIVPYFGKQKISKINTLQLTQYFNEQTTSTEKKYNVMQSIFKKAKKWEVVTNNPMTEVEKPKQKKAKNDFYDVDELRILFSKLDGLALYQRAAIELAAVGGLRRGEVLALTDNEINGNEIKIWRSLQESKEGGLRLKATKSEDARTVTVPDWLIKELKKLHLQQKQRKMESGNLWEGFKGEIMLFANEFGVPYRPHSLSTFWRRFVKREKLRKISFHDLRHSSASLMISQGINMKVVQMRLGHKDISTTLNIYSHVTKTDDEKASDIFKNLK